MSEEMKKVDVDSLEEVSGGKKHHTGHRDSLSDCPPGTIEVKNEQLSNKHEKRKKCPNCKAEHGLEEHYFYMVDTQTLVEGQICTKCQYKWITHG